MTSTRRCIRPYFTTNLHVGGVAILASALFSSGFGEFGPSLECYSAPVNPQYRQKAGALAKILTSLLTCLPL